MTDRLFFWIGVACFAVTAGCGGESASGDASRGEEPVTAATLGVQEVLTPPEWRAAEPYASADRAAGEKEARVCRACHSLEAGGPNMIGPNLYGFFGRQIGTVEGYQYSAVVAAADFVWTPRALDAWLREPARFLPGNRMTYPGLPGQANRDALIRYLLDVTSDTNGQE